MGLSSISIKTAARPETRPEGVVTDPPERFNVVVLGDFTGRTNRGILEPISTRKLREIDLDTLAPVFAQLQPRLNLVDLAPSAGAIGLKFSTLDDFHPDQLLTKASTLVSLAEARRLVLNPATAEQGRTALQAYLGAANAPTTQTTDPAVPARESDQQTIARLLGEKAEPAGRAAAHSSSIDEFIRRLVAPHVSAAPGNWLASLLSAVDLELSARLNQILHHPGFQRLEALWRGVEQLTHRIESSEDTGLYLLDVSLAELQTHGAAPDGAEESPLLRLLRDRAPRLIIGDYTFGQNVEDLRLLTRLGEVAARLGATFIATAASQLVGCDTVAAQPEEHDWRVRLPGELATAWASLRQAPQAERVGLAWPRFLSRQPYGKTGETIDSFPFEELPPSPAHESFLWGPPALLCACSVIEAWQAGDLESAGFRGGEIGDLPVHKLAGEDRTEIKPYAETWLSERAVEHIDSCGIIPLVALKDRNVIRLYPFRSISATQPELRLGQ